VIFGTGIGAGIILDGKIYSGTTGSAGEFGHNQIDPNGPRDRVGIRGTVESFAGGPNIIRNYFAAGGRKKDMDIYNIFDSKDPVAKKVVDTAVSKLAVGLASLWNILNPELIVLGGGLSNKRVYKKLNTITKKYTMDGLRKNVKIVKNKLGDDAGIYGAAALVLTG
jgi:predicted NBD/HSP70 family sugar kinase